MKSPSVQVIQLHLSMMFSPHNVIVEDHPELTHDGLFASGESFDITFPDLVTTPSGVILTKVGMTGIT